MNCLLNWAFWCEAGMVQWQAKECLSRSTLPASRWFIYLILTRIHVFSSSFVSWTWSWNKNNLFNRSVAGGPFPCFVIQSLFLFFLLDRIVLADCSEEESWCFFLLWCSEMACSCVHINKQERYACLSLYSSLVFATSDWLIMIYCGFEWPSSVPQAIIYMFMWSWRRI